VVGAPIVSIAYRDLRRRQRVDIRQSGARRELGDGERRK
jgi:hypothetical protein